MKKHISEISAHENIYQDTRTGIAFVENTSTGQTSTLHPNIDATGSVAGMKKQGMWDKTDKVISMGGFKYNIDRYVPENDKKINEALVVNCKCGGRHSHELHKDREANNKGPQR